MGSLAAARSALRSSSVRSSAAKFASSSAAMPKPASSPFRLPAAPRILRSPVESSFCVESLLPMHSATASALMTSMLAVTRGGYGWLSDGELFMLSSSSSSSSSRGGYGWLSDGQDDTR